MTTTALTQFTSLPVPSAEDGYAAYVRAVNAIPQLSEDEEKQLAEDYQENRNVTAAHKLSLSHLRLVVAVARGYRGYGIEQGDLVQEGNIGLLKAVRKFNPKKGVRLATYAVYWIRAEIHNFILRNWRIVKIATTKAQRKLFFNMRQLFEKNAGGVLREAELVAKDVGVREQDVTDMRQRINNTNSIIFDGDDDNPGTQLILHAQEETSDPEQALLNKENSGASELHSAIAKLDERSRAIIESRHIKEPPSTLHALAKQFGISAERVRQLENQALKKMRLQLSASS